MDISALINSPLLSLVGALVPQAAPIIAIVQRFAPVITEAAPVLQAVIKEGGSAFAAAKEQAPEIVTAVTNLFHNLPANYRAALGATPAIMKENITRQLIGVHAMTSDEERDWLDHALPQGHDDSRTGSG